MRSLNEITKWSNLSRLAGGRLTRLTIAAPFLAFIILHNEPLQPFLDLSESRHPNQYLEVLALARFDIFYLGLVIIGLAVGIYSVLCPDQIKVYDGYEDFIVTKEGTKTANGIAGSLRLTLEIFAAQSRDPEAALEAEAADTKFPRRFVEAANRLFEAIRRDVEIERKARNGESGVHEAAPSLGGILQMFTAQRREERAASEIYYSALPPYSIDVFRLEYLRSDYSRPGSRHFIFWMLILGMAIVLIPTVITTYLVIQDLVTALSA